jgi:hypothetical protein
MSFSNILKKNSDVLHPVMAGNEGNSNGNSVVCHFKIFVSAV